MQAAGPELTRLLRAMAGLKLMFAALLLGALLLYGGLLGTVVLLWRDPAVGARLGAVLAKRRAILRARG